MLNYVEKVNVRQARIDALWVKEEPEDRVDIGREAPTKNKLLLW